MLLPSLLAAKNNGGELAGMLLVLFCLFGTEYAFFFFLVLVLLAITCPTIYSDAWMDGGNGRGAECGGNASTVREPYLIVWSALSGAGQGAQPGREKELTVVYAVVHAFPPYRLFFIKLVSTFPFRRGEGRGEVRGGICQPVRSIQLPRGSGVIRRV